MTKLFLLLTLLSFSKLTWAQNTDIQSPANFLGYKLGEAFTYHHRMVDYFQYLSQSSNKVKLVPYGETSERRPLIAAFISAPENIANLEAYRQANLQAIGLSKGSIGTQKPFIWLSYNIHGNEPSSMEAAMEVLYTLAISNQDSIEQWLKDVIVVIDPCENPDGRDRYTNWYNQVAHQTSNIDKYTREHLEPWPGGRFNHYLFDLNRDWAWQTQRESRQRIAFYQQYMPHIHVDLHEMSYNAPYFFGPSAEPFHKSITDWQREFHLLSGPNHAKYFDPKGWLYFTKETYDLFYPSYGDTWPIFNGAMGFTYEQGGGGSAGIAIKTAEGDTLTLADRIAHHYTTSISTIELGYTHRARLIEEFNQYFQQGQTSPDGDYKSYIVKGNQNSNRLRALMELLDKQHIKYGKAKAIGKKRGFSGFNYLQNKPGNFSVENNDLVISAYQPQHHLLKVLFEPKPILSDSMTYDMTAWAIPYVYGLETYATDAKIEVEEFHLNDKITNKAPNKKPYAYLASWGDVANVRFLAALLQKGIKARYAELPFKVQQTSYPAGTLIITQRDNRYIGDFEQLLMSLANEYQQTLTPAPSAIVEKGKDFGSTSVHLIKAPRVVTVCGEGIKATAYGEVWHFFEEIINYPISSISTKQLSHADLSDFDVLILPSGRYGSYHNQILSFVEKGGKVIAMDEAVRLFEKEGTKLGIALSAKGSSSNTKANLAPYATRERERLSYGVEGSIYRVSLDASHPLSFGLPNPFFLVKRNSKVYPYMFQGGWNVGIYKEQAHIAGFVGAKLKPKIDNSLAFGTEPLGEGTIIYFPDSPIYRGFWHSGMGLMGNAVFLVGN